MNSSCWPLADQAQHRGGADERAQQHRERLRRRGLLRRRPAYRERRDRVNLGDRRAQCVDAVAEGRPGDVWRAGVDLAVAAVDLAGTALGVGRGRGRA